MRRRIAKIGTVVTLATGVVVVGREIADATRRRRLTDYLARRRRYLEGRLEGIRYRAGGRQPDPNVSDDVLADRVRSQLGPLEKRLDLPRVHVTVVDHLVYLHGSVDTDAQCREIEYATMDVSGVQGLASHLHVGLAPSDTRPSEGAASRPRSEARRRLLAAARNAGLFEEWAETGVRAVLGALADRIPDDEHRHLLSHLPDDVKSWFVKPKFFGSQPPPRTVQDLLVEVVGLGLRPASLAEEVCMAVYAELQRLVPEEVADIAATLPGELSDLWKRATPAR